MVEALKSVPLRKRCPKCECTKPLTDFHKSRASKDGRQGRCKECERARRKERYHTEWTQRYGREEADRRLVLWQRKQDLASGFKICARCEETKKASDFYKNVKLKDGRSSYCRECASAQTKEYRCRTPEDRLAISLNTSRVSARTKGMEHDLCVEDLVRLWEGQEGRCHYTGIEMAYDGKGAPNSVSVDRIDSEAGYTLGNIVLCCVHVNRMKNNLAVGDFVRWCRLVVQYGQKNEEPGGQ